MTSPTPRQPAVNTLGLSKNDYKGVASTLCPGCGHESIASRIIDASYSLSIKPHAVMKLSGIGCSSKSPAYFLNGAHGINTVHGRMPSVATGAKMAQHGLIALAVSGDGDTGSIGLGQFKHVIRRNLPMVYIVENNGVYGLTKGQLSPTADIGQGTKYKAELPPLDLAAEAIVAGAGFVARSFAGDAKQVTELIKAALSFDGIAVIDIVSPCVTFNNHERSTKSYTYGKAHEIAIHDIEVLEAGFIKEYPQIVVDYDEGEVIDVDLHDGHHIHLKKLANNHDPRDKVAALRLLEESRQKGEFLTGLLYLNEERKTLVDIANLTDTPLALLPEEKVRPSRESLEKLMEEFA